MKENNQTDKDSIYFHRIDGDRLFGETREMLNNLFYAINKWKTLHQHIPFSCFAFDA